MKLSLTTTLIFSLAILSIGTSARTIVGPLSSGNDAASIATVRRAVPRSPQQQRQSPAAVVPNAPASPVRSQPVAHLEHRYNGPAYVNLHTAVENIIKMGAITVKDISSLDALIRQLKAVEPQFGEELSKMLHWAPPLTRVANGIHSYLKFFRDMTAPNLSDNDRIKVIIHYTFSRRGFPQFYYADKYLQDPVVARKVKKSVKRLHIAFSHFHGWKRHVNQSVPLHVVRNYEDAAWELITGREISDPLVQAELRDVPYS